MTYFSALAVFWQSEPVRPTTPAGVSGSTPTHLLIPMYSTQGIEAVATVTELRSRTSALIDQAKGLKTGIMIQKNNEPEAVLLGVAGALTQSITRNPIASHPSRG